MEPVSGLLCPREGFAPSIAIAPVALLALLAAGAGCSGQPGDDPADAGDEDLAGVLDGYEVAAILAGHTHFAMTYQWKGMDVIQANNAKAEIDQGNEDGNGSFAVMRIGDFGIWMVTCRWLDGDGNFEMVALSCRFRLSG